MVRYAAVVCPNPMYDACSEGHQQRATEDSAVCSGCSSLSPALMLCSIVVLVHCVLSVVFSRCGRDLSEHTGARPLWPSGQSAPHTILL